jgi:hypothetical protein
MVQGERSVLVSNEKVPIGDSGASGSPEWAG